MQALAPLPLRENAASIFVDQHRSAVAHDVIDIAPQEPLGKDRVLDINRPWTAQIFGRRRHATMENLL
jgi:hypothetical protein